MTTADRDQNAACVAGISDHLAFRSRIAPGTAKLRDQNDGEAGEVGG